MAIMHEATPVQIVMHIRALDDSFHVTHIMDRVDQLEYMEEGNASFCVGTEFGIRGRAIPVGPNERHLLTYDHERAQPNLDDFLKTFTKHQRIEMAKAYVKKTEAEIKKTLDDLGVDILRNYLEKNGFEVLEEQGLDDE